MLELQKRLTTFDEKKADLNQLLSLSRLIKKTDISNDKNRKQLRIAVLGSKNTQFFVKTLEVLLIKDGYIPEIYEGEYDSITFEILDTTSGLYHFSPDYVIILPDHRDIKAYPPLLATKEVVEQWISHQKDYYFNLWKKITKHLQCEILHANFVLPLDRVLGQLEMSVPYSKQTTLAYLNLQLMEDKPAHVHLIDLDSISNAVGKIAWFDEKNYYLNKSSYNLAYLPLVARQFLHKINGLNGKVKKVLVLDLDNTLWGGVIGDDGPKGINLDPFDAVGEAYLAFQTYVLELKNSGIILAVCSKNDEAVAKSGFTENPNIILKLTDIACFIANWNNKADNLKIIAQTLNVGLDSLVFFDDNPAERAIVQDFLPEVTVIDVPADPAYYRYALAEAQCFERLELTREDLERNGSYLANTIRLEQEKSFINYDEYLQSLQMIGVAKELESSDVQRFAQLTNKSNQFNVRTIRYSVANLENLLANTTHRLLSIKLQDCFSDYGLIACIVLEKRGTVCFIENWLMSCRVLKRNVEDFTLKKIVAIAQDFGTTTIEGEYIPSAKNSLVKNLYSDLGFTEIRENYYQLLVTDFQNRPIFIEEGEIKNEHYK